MYSKQNNDQQMTLMKMTMTCINDKVNKTMTMLKITTIDNNDSDENTRITTKLMMTMFIALLCLLNKYQ